MGGGGDGHLVHLSYSSNSGAAKICQRGQSEGRVWEGGTPICPTVGRFFSPNLCIKLAFFCTLDTIIRGSLCTGIDQFPTLFLFSFFSYWKFQGNIFLFLFPFPFVTPSKKKKLRGATAPIAPPGYATGWTTPTQYQQWSMNGPHTPLSVYLRVIFFGCPYIRQCNRFFSGAEISAFFAKIIFQI